MKDWKTVELKALSPQDRAKYCLYMRILAKERYDAVQVLYKKYKALPAEVIAHLVHLDMQKSGWDNAPDKLVSEVAAELMNVRGLFGLCRVSEEYNPDEYVDASNKDEIYKALLELHRQDDLKKQAQAAEAFCKSTQMGGSR